MSKRIKVKPGKTQSAMGFAVGIVFCLIGVFVVIPSAGLFGVFWTLMAGIITVTNGINTFSHKGVASHEIVIDDDTGRSHASTCKENSEAECRGTADGGSAISREELRGNIELRLRTAEDLYKAGTITREEYEKKREEILKEL